MSKFTVPQQNVIAFLQTVNPATKRQLLDAKLDMRAVAAVVKNGSASQDGENYYLTPMAPCLGEAHTNASIDNCGVCAPNWGEVPAKVVELVKEGLLTPAAPLPVAETKVVGKPRRASKKPQGIGICLCGCGTSTPRRFVPGHDGKLHGAVYKAMAGKAPFPIKRQYTADYVLAAKWCKPAIEQMIRQFADECGYKVA